ncbi:MAG: alcohol dehydrogenase catalytic domain-containing protein [Lachnospiraceae bacterium]|nr:alcohol dehydrogenase catalytic domain-containing protein [Candidatus Equihabitans merdae]
MEERKMMKALRLNAPNDFEVTEVPVPVAGESEVLCKVESVSICGTDPHIIKGEFPGVWPQEFPLIPGHEWAGTVVELGDKAADFGWKVGDRVCGIANLGCGHCKNCMEGRFTICLNYGKPRIHKMYGHISQGAYAEYMAVNIRAISKIPDYMDFDVACQMDTMSIAMHMIERSNFEVGDDVLVSGAGPQGMMSVIIFKAMGARNVYCAGSGVRLKKCEELGAIPIDYTKEDVAETIMKYTNGAGVKRVVECTGTAKGVYASCWSVARGGAIATVGFPAGDVPMPVRHLVMDEISFNGSRANPNTLDKAIVIASQHLDDVKNLVTHVFPLTEYPKAYEVFTKRLDNSIRVVVKP